jgi:hypothetical protein
VIALAVGTVLALLALAVVLYPLFSDSGDAAPRVTPEAREPTRAEQAIAALREIEFDRETGKLSQRDYEALRATYMPDALAAMRAEESATASMADEEVEAAILKYRTRRLSCVSCGPRPEANAVYCSTCGRYLAGACGRCGAPVTALAARFCVACGSALAA